MKTRFILIFAAFAVLFASCEKNRLASSADPASDKVIVALSLDNSTRGDDSIDGIFFPDADNSGTIIFGRGYFTVMSVPVNADGETLDWEKAIVDSPRDARTKKDKTFSRVMYCATGKNTAEWFANDKGYGCIFFAVIAGNSNYNSFGTTIRYLQIVNNVENPGDYTENILREEYYSSQVNQPIRTYTIGGIDKTFVKAYLPMDGSGRSTWDKRNWEEYGEVDFSSTDHIIGAHSGIVSREDVFESKFVNFSAFAPCGALLRFNMKLSEGSMTISRVDATIENTGDNMAGSYFMDFSDYQNNNYPLYSVKSLSSETGIDLINTDVLYTAYYLQDDGETYDTTYTLNWEDKEGQPQSMTLGPQSWPFNTTFDSRYVSSWTYYDHDKEYERWSQVTLSTTPSEKYTYIGLLPQTRGLSDDSRIVFKIYDTQGDLISTVKKKLPDGGFRSGVRYDFTLTFPVYGIGADAGKYDTVVW